MKFASPMKQNATNSGVELITNMHAGGPQSNEIQDLSEWEYE